MAKMDSLKGIYGYQYLCILILVLIQIENIASQCNFPANFQGVWRVGTTETTSFSGNTETVTSNGVPTLKNCLEGSPQTETLSGNVITSFVWLRQEATGTKCTKNAIVTSAENVMVYWGESSAAAPTQVSDCTGTFLKPPRFYTEQGGTSTCDVFSTWVNAMASAEYDVGSGGQCVNDASSIADITSATDLDLNTCFPGTATAERPLKASTLQCVAQISPTYIGDTSIATPLFIFSYEDTSGTKHYYCTRILFSNTELFISLDTSRTIDGILECVTTQTPFTATTSHITTTLSAADCVRGACKNGAACVQGELGVFTCTCLPGYTGTNCETDIDECASDPCQNGGTCNNLVNQRTCDCVPSGEFGGVDCEDRNACYSDPCQNGGTCIDLDTSYTCTCPEGQTGTDCETKLMCVPDPCENGGTCTEDFPNSDFDCACPTGFAGAKCQTELYCEPGPCLNGATCSEGTAVAICGCADGFTGAICETELFCTSAKDPCLNSATCQEQGASASCACAPGFTGEFCETELFCTTDNKCLNGATCQNGATMAICICVDGYTGEYCETELQCTTRNPCQNGATCIEDTPRPTCTCPSAFTGETCSQAKFCEPISPCRDPGTVRCDEPSRKCICMTGYAGSLCDLKLSCTPNPCENGGTCNTDSDGNAVCICAVGKTGTLCDTEILPCDSAPCESGATCIDNIDNTYACTCPEGKTGTNCDEDKDECPFKPCENGGTCDESSKVCSCPAGFRGPLCAEVCPVPSDCPGGTDSTTPPGTGTTPGGGTGSTTPGGTGGGDGGDGDDGFDLLPVILTTSIIGGLLLIAGCIWCVCCLSRSGESGRKDIKYPYPPIGPPIMAPAFIGAAAPSIMAPFAQSQMGFPQAQMVSAPSFMTAPGPFIEEPMVSSPEILATFDAGNDIAPPPPRIMALSKKKRQTMPVSQFQARPPSILRRKPQSEMLVTTDTNGDPVYYSESGRAPSVRYSGTLTNRPINASVRGFGGDYINADFYPDM